MFIQKYYMHEILFTLIKFYKQSLPLNVPKYVFFFNLYLS